jgi:hypothetical protein
VEAEAGVAGEPAATGAEARHAAALAVLVALALVAPCARAAPTDAELRAARLLFADAEKDEDAGRWQDALEKLRRVAEVKPTAGVRSHVALCEEHIGQLARALDDYAAAETQAGADGAKDVLRFVGKRLAELGPRVPRLTIRVEPPVPDAVVTLDGAALSPSLLGVAIPVDPGEHTLEATAKGYPTVRRTLAMRERDTTSVDVNLTETAAPPAPATPAPPAPAAPPPAPAAPTEGTATPSSTGPLPDPFLREPSGPSQTAAWISTAGAVALAGGGVAAYLLAGSAHTSAVEQCARTVSTATDACDGPRNTVRAWDATAAIAWLGAAGVGALAVVLWTRPAASQASARVMLVPGGVVLGGRF